METIANRVVFAVAGIEYRWRDVFAAAKRWSDWEALERRTAQGIACRRRLEEKGEELPGDEFEAAGDEFRYRRNLLAADELERWLDARDLTVDEWVEYVRGSVLREQWGDELDDITERYPADPAEIFGFLRIEAVCSGWLPALAAKVAARVATLDAAGGDPPRPTGDAPISEDELEGLDETYERFVESAASSEALSREIDQHALDWTRLDCRVAAFPDPDVAREAALIVTEDRRDLADACASAGASVRTERVYVGEAEPGLRERLLGAQPGHVVGPVPADGGSELYVIDARVTPSPADPAIRERARRLVVARAVQRELSDRARWSDRP